MFSFGLNFEVGSNPATELSHYRDKECIGAGKATCYRNEGKTWMT